MSSISVKLNISQKEEGEKMAEDFRRHDISDRMWTLLQAYLPGRKGSYGRNARDNRQFINAVIWILRTGAPWRDLLSY